MGGYMFIKSERCQDKLETQFQGENKVTSLSDAGKTFTRKKPTTKEIQKKLQNNFYLCSCDLIGHNFDLFDFMFDTDVVFLSSEQLID